MSIFYTERTSLMFRGGEIMPVITDEYAGKRLYNYSIHECIHEGVYYNVYRAYDSVTNRDVALKIIRLDQINLPVNVFTQRFIACMEQAVSLEHVHIQTIYQYQVDDDIAFIAGRLMPGGSLRDLLQKQPLSMLQAVELLEQISRGLSYAHQNGVTHGHLTPSNILVDDEGNLSIADFGLTHLLYTELEPSSEIYFVGDPVYMAPENFLALKTTHQADIYSMGIILYEMLSGRPPFLFNGSNLAQIIYQHLYVSPPSLHKILPTIPQEAETVIATALAKKPENRFVSFDELASRFRDASRIKAINSTFQEKLTIRKSYSALNWLSTSNWLNGIFLMFLILISLFLILRNPQETPLLPPVGSIMMGEVGKPEDIIPTDVEISIAQKRMGKSGFIAIVTCNRTSEYHAGAIREISESLEDYSLPARIYDSESDSTRQIVEIEKALGDGAQGFVICPLNIDLISNQLEILDEKDIPLALFTAGESTFGGVTLEGNNYELGREAGQFTGAIIRDELGGQADVIILDYPSLPNLVERANGIEEGLLELAPQANIIGRYIGAVRERAKTSVTDVLRNGARFNVVVSINDAGAYGAIDALVNNGYLPSEVIIVGIDAETSAREDIDNHYFMRGSVIIDRETEMQVLVNGLVKLLSGETVPERVFVPPGDIYIGELPERKGN